MVETPVSRDQLYIADEVFVSGTAAECIALCEIDFREIGDGKTGPVTRAIQRAFHDAVHGRSPRSQNWLQYVDEGLPSRLPANLPVRDEASVSGYAD
jgi:branched-chain amino acid aminotransferase